MSDSPGLIGIIAQETARYSYFAASLTGLEVPEGSEVKWIFGHDIPANMNRLADEMLAREWAEWLWILNDDHSFSPRILTSLLAHGKDITVPLCLMRNPPYRPVLYIDQNEETGLRIPVILDEYPADAALIEVKAAGAAGMLVSRRVLETMPRPWFAADTVHGQLGEDLFFCDQARAHGFEVWADLGTPLGHCTSAVVWPVREGDGWTFAFSMTGGFNITLPPGFQTLADQVAVQA